MTTHQRNPQQASTFPPIALAHSPAPPHRTSAHTRQTPRIPTPLRGIAPIVNGSRQTDRTGGAISAILTQYHSFRIAHRQEFPQCIGRRGVPWNYAPATQLDTSVREIRCGVAIHPRRFSACHLHFDLVLVATAGQQGYSTAHTAYSVADVEDTLRCAAEQCTSDLTSCVVGTQMQTRAHCEFQLWFLVGYTYVPDSALSD